MRPFCASQFTGGLLTHPDWGGKHVQITRESSFSAPVTSLFALCLFLWTCDLRVPDCTLRQSLDTHSEGFYSADIGMATNTISNSALHALCLRSWPAVRLSASTSQSAADAEVVFSAPFDVSSSTLL
ncbi:TPA: hypothetical protein ACH3X2_000786 [Trebouxia sp. C0005]